MRREYDFSKGERGKFYRPDMKLNIPIYLDDEVSAFVDKIASKKGAEIAFIHGAYSKKYNVTPASVGEGGRLLADLLSGPDGESKEMKRQIDTLPSELGCDNQHDFKNIH